MNIEKAGWIALSMLITGIIIVAVFYNKEMSASLQDNVKTSQGAINNPGNINKYWTDENGVKHLTTQYEGEIDSPSCCKKSFISMAYGYRAMIVIIRYYFYHYNLKNLYDIIGRYDGYVNVENYADFVAAGSGLDKHQDLTDIIDTDVVKDIVRAMSLFEQGNGFVVNDQWVNDGYNLV